MDEGMTFDTVTALLACAGEATLWYALMQVGLLEKQEDFGGIPVPAVRSDPYHIAVIAIGELPARLIFDADFGWLWYNADGPEAEP